MTRGVSLAAKKDGTPYYRASITYKNKHISLGSYTEQSQAQSAYNLAYEVLFLCKYNYLDMPPNNALSFEKWIILHNFRDNGYYFKNPIYMHKYYFSYYIQPDIELEFDVDDLFYYAHHKIFKRDGYYFVNDFGTQTNIMLRYGIKNFAVLGKDYYFKDNNPLNLRYHNIVVVNRFIGVEKRTVKNKDVYVAKIHVRGNFIIGKYSTDIKAAVAYNKTVDFLKDIVNKQYTKNYIHELTSSQYMEIYKSIKLPPKILNLGLLNQK